MSSIASAVTDFRYVSQSLKEQAISKKLFESGVWAALLHHSKNEFKIKDKGFILSSSDFSLQNELVATIEYLYAANPLNVCRFPARYLWLRHELDGPELPIDKCAELSEFKENAPAENISLVFASENLSQPSSMMGHLFLKLSGQDHKETYREHAISFFTDANTINLPKLLYDSIVTGKKGYFSLSPYFEQVSAYVAREQRTLWEYELRFTDFERSLIQLHIYELKNTEFKYFFQGYNCATLVKHVLAVGAPTILERSERWTTPKDVVKLADESGIIGNTVVRSPSRWMTRVLSQSLTGDDGEAIKSRVLRRDADITPSTEPSKLGYVGLELASAYNNYLFENDEISTLEWKTYAVRVSEIKDRAYPGYQLEAPQQKNPSHAPQDSQLSLGLHAIGDKRYVRFDFMPAAHGIEDNNEEYLSENELKLFEVSVLKEINTNHIDLDRLTIYSTRSLLPRDRFSGGISGEFRIGMDSQFEQFLTRKMTFVVKGAVGVTFRIANDIDVFSLLGLGVGQRSETHLRTHVEAGAVIREVFNMKSVISVSSMQNQMPSHDTFHEINLIQSIHVSKDFSIIAQAKNQLGNTGNQKTFSLLLKKMF